MYRDEAAAELGHFRAADGRLEPLSMVECGVPVVNGRMVAAEGDLQVVALIKTYHGSLDFRIESGRRRAADPRVGSGRETEFAKKTHSWRKGRTEVQRELSLVETGMRVQQRSRSEAAGRAAEVRRGKIKVGKSRNLERGIGFLG